MRWLLVPLLWVAAIVLALLIAWRARRGKHVVLRGRLSPRLIRMVVVVLVVLGFGGEEKSNPTADAAPLLPLKNDPYDQLPQAISADTVKKWVTLERQSPAWSEFKLAYTKAAASGRPTPAQFARLRQLVGQLPNAMQSFIQADIDAWADGKPTPSAEPAEVLRMLSVAESFGCYDHWLTAYLWRKTAGPAKPEDAKKRVEIYARLRQHARITDALIRAHAQIRPVMMSPRAWMSKAGPSKEQRAIGAAFELAVKDMLKVAAEVYPATDEGTWLRDGLAQLRAVKGSPTPALIRGGRTKGFPADETVRFGRLDLLETPAGDAPAVVENPWLGKIELPAGRVISAWELPSFLSKEARETVRKAVKDALDGDEASAERLERALPLVHSFVREGLKDTPAAKGAPRLRLILALFDDAVMPRLPEPEAKSLPAFGGGPGFGGGGGGPPPGGGRGFGGGQREEP